MSSATTTHAQLALMYSSGANASSLVVQINCRLIMDGGNSGGMPGGPERSLAALVGVTLELNCRYTGFARRQVYRPSVTMGCKPAG